MSLDKSDPGRPDTGIDDQWTIPENHSELPELKLTTVLTTHTPVDLGDSKDYEATMCNGHLVIVPSGCNEIQIFDERGYKVEDFKPNSRKNILKVNWGEIGKITNKKWLKKDEISLGGNDIHADSLPECLRSIAQSALKKDGNYIVLIDNNKDAILLDDGQEVKLDTEVEDDKWQPAFSVIREYKIISAEEGRYLILYNDDCESAFIFDTEKTDPRQWPKIPVYYYSNIKDAATKMVMSHVLADTKKRAEEKSGNFRINERYVVKAEEGRIVIEDDKENAPSKQVKFTDPITGVGNNIAFDPSSGNHVVYYCRNANAVKLSRLDTEPEKPEEWKTGSLTLPKQYAEVKDLKIHPSGRFFYFTCNGTLVILRKDDKNNLSELKEYPSSSLEVEPGGRYYLVKQQDRVIVLHKDTFGELGAAQSSGNLRHCAGGRLYGLNESGHAVVYDTNIEELERIAQEKSAATALDQLDITGLLGSILGEGDGGVSAKASEKAEVSAERTRQFPQAVINAREKIDSQFLSQLDSVKTAAEADRWEAVIAKYAEKMKSSGLSDDIIDYILSSLTGRLSEIRSEIDSREREKTERELAELIADIRRRMEGIDEKPAAAAEDVLTQINAGISKFDSHGLKVTELQDLRREAERVMNRHWEGNRERLLKEIEGQAGDVMEMAERTVSLAALQQFRENDRAYIALLERLDTLRAQIGSESVRKIKTDIQAAIERKRAALCAEEESFRQKRVIERQERCEEVKDAIMALESRMQDEISNSAEYRRFVDIEGSAELRRVRGTIEALAKIDDEQSAERQKDRDNMRNLLKGMLAKHEARAENAEILRMDSGGDPIFGSETFPRCLDYAKVTQVTWETGFDITPHPTDTNRDQFEIYFVSSKGEKHYLREILAEAQEACGATDIPGRITRRDFYLYYEKDDFYINAIKRHLEAKSNAASALGRVPEIPDELVFTEEIVGSLEKLAKLSRMQLGIDRNGVQRKDPQGMVLLEGDTGTGKDILIDIFANKTNRPLFVFDCSKWTQRNEFSYTYEFDGRTIRVESEVQKALATPGAILYFNEYSELDQAAQKYLNSLLSHRRQVRSAFNGNRRTEKDVLIYGSMNGRKGYHGNKIEPSNMSRIRYLEVDYLQETITRWPYQDSVKTGAQAFASLKGLGDLDLAILWVYVTNKTVADENRDRLAELSTKPRLAAMTQLRNALISQGKLTNGAKIWHYSEAYAMAKMYGAFRSMKEADFKTVWEHVFHDIPAGADIINAGMEKILIAFKVIVQVANDIRRQFRATQSEAGVDDGSEVSFIFSIRESIECAKEIDDAADLYESGEALASHVLEEVVMPKISSPEERTFIRAYFGQGVKKNLAAA